MPVLLFFSRNTTGIFTDPRQSEPHFNILSERWPFCWTQSHHCSGTLGSTQSSGWAASAGLSNTSSAAALILNFPGSLSSRCWPALTLLSFSGSPRGLEKHWVQYHTKRHTQIMLLTTHSVWKLTCSNYNRQTHHSAALMLQQLKSCISSLQKWCEAALMCHLTVFILYDCYSNMMEMVYESKKYNSAK